MHDTFDVKLSRQAEKDLNKLPIYIVIRLYAWIDAIGHDGLHHTRKIPSYHDEPLKGVRIGQRSIRLNRSYRAIYIIHNDKKLQIIEIVEIHKHAY